MRLLLVVNPSASSVTARNRVVIQKALSADHHVTVAETSRRGHAMRLTQGAAASGVDVVVTFGGDGTVNEAANGLAGATTALATLPGGSTNVFARTIGLPNDPVEAAAGLLEALATDSIEPVGLGRVNGRYFCFHTGVGFDAAVVDRVERRGHLKRWAGHPLFIWATLVTLALPGRDGRPRFDVITADSEPVRGAAFAVVQNTDPYTFLGNRPLALSPAAGLHEPLTAVCFRSLGPATMGRALRAALARRPLPQTRALRTIEGLRSFVVRADRPFPYQVDGEYLGTTERLEFHWDPAVLRLVVA